MENKFITIMVVPDRKQKVHKLVLSASQLKLILWGAGLLVVIAAAIMVDYLGLLSQSIENKRLHAENAELRSQFQVVQSKLNSLEDAMDRIKTFTTKLKLITAVNDPDRNLNLAMGPLTHSQQEAEEMHQDMNQREPASAVFDEPVFKPRNIEDLATDELAREQEDHDYSSLSIRIEQDTRLSQIREQNIQKLWEFLQDRSALLSSTPSVKPVMGWYTSRFGYRLSPYTDQPKMHEGVDIAAAPGSPVYSPADGIVTYSGYEAGYGKLVIVDNGYGVQTRFGHNSQIHVTVGQKVRRGDLIANVGSTGRSTGPHLHYEVRVNGQPVDPLNYILEE